MPSVRIALERLQWEANHGNADEKVHITWVERDAAERIKNDKRVTKFVLETKDADACSELHAEWERIIRRVKNKSICLSLVIRALKEALSDGELARILAQMEGPPE